jgi:acetyltransferase-like isoleucine patch superfamily enzyme
LTIHVAQSVTIGEGTLVAADCFMTDHDGHPSAYVDRIEGKPPPLHEARSVAIGRNVWIGRNCMILKGVTIGEGAIVGAGSVVRSDIPPFAIAIGNPARVVREQAPVQT